MTLKLLVAFVFASITLCAQSKEEVALNNLAVSLMDKGDYKEALAHLDRLTASDENNFIYRYNRAVTLFNLKKYQEAIGEYKYLHTLLPEQSEYIFQIGNAYEQLDSTNFALTFYTQAIEMDQDQFLYFFKRGTVFLKQNELQRAEADLTSSIELNPKHHNSFHNRGITLFKLGQVSKACDDWCRASVLGNVYSGNYFRQNCAKVQACVTPK
jgi:tetratricopeptide (TPR) repeat protein